MTQNSSDYLAGFSENQIWVDENTSLSGGELSALLAKIDQYLGWRLKERKCIAFVMENSVYHALVLLYLFRQELNFYLVSTYSPLKSTSPAFCDIMLSLHAVNNDTDDFLNSIRIVLNPAYVYAPKSDEVPESGCVYLSSSGTTGDAKFVFYTQKSMMQNARNVALALHFVPSSKVLISVPVMHMYGLGAGLLAAITSGSSLCLIGNNNVIKLLQQLSNFRPDIALVNFTLVRMMVTLNKQVSSRCLYVTAGEKTDSKIYKSFESSFGILCNLYGCTELGAVAISPLGAAQQDDRISGLLYPLSDTQVEIRSTTTGVLFCRHGAAFEGYVDSLARISDKKGNVDSWYETGDLAEEYPGQAFKIRGRKDNCINRSGFLVSLEEINSLLQNLYPELTQVIVFESAQPNPMASGALKLVAVCQSEIPPAEGSRILEDCRSKMHRYLVPDLIYIIPKLPRLPSGKPDIKMIIQNYQ
jgi:acyl-coenzyme A synthetase/AMP-(fatty) acid ligase